MMRFGKGYIKWLIVIILLLLALFGLYLNRFQEVVNEGSYLADEHCIKINPLIINRKKAYLDQYNLMVASASSDIFLASLAKYQIAAKQYTEEEEKWLAKQRKFLDSQSFKLLTPSTVKEATEYQYQWYEGEYLSSVYIIQAFEEHDKVKQEELSLKVLEETDRSISSEKKYNELWERNRDMADWRYKYFINIPTPICPKENWDFPIVPNPFAPPIPFDSNAPLS